MEQKRTFLESGIGAKCSIEDAASTSFQNTSRSNKSVFSGWTGMGQSEPGMRNRACSIAPLR
jgi:hypothetical protein